MEPKQKAKELFDLYFDMKWQSYSHRKTSIKSMTKLAAKQCAMIAVDEIIKQEKNHMHHLWVESWQQVKTEINSL